MENQQNKQANETTLPPPPTPRNPYPIPTMQIKQIQKKQPQKRILKPKLHLTLALE